LVARDSADVWAHLKFFKLDLASGAPPDECFADGQKWGMPPYDWEAMRQDNYDYLIRKLRYAENFYDLYRIDHFVGLFRIWVFSQQAAEAQDGMLGHFDPLDETLWEGQGRQILSAMLQGANMLPCAEDLGTVPKCSPKVLKEFAIPGMEIQRWAKDYELEVFKTPETYRPNSIAVISTHDISPLKTWWKSDIVDPAERQVFWEYLGLKGEYTLESTASFIRAALLKINESESVFSIQLLQDWLSLGDLPGSEDPDFRINYPGTVSDKNWTIRMPFFLEEIEKLPVNSVIREIIKKTNRT
jgi:4-alpha-glucanotransferase